VIAEEIANYVNFVQRSFEKLSHTQSRLASESKKNLAPNRILHSLTSETKVSLKMESDNASGTEESKQDNVSESKRDAEYETKSKDVTESEDITSTENFDICTSPSENSRPAYSIYAQIDAILDEAYVRNATLNE